MSERGMSCTTSGTRELIQSCSFSPFTHRLKLRCDRQVRVLLSVVRSLVWARRARDTDPPASPAGPMRVVHEERVRRALSRW